MSILIRGSGDWCREMKQLWSAALMFLDLSRVPEDEERTYGDLWEHVKSGAELEEGDLRTLLASTCMDAAASRLFAIEELLTPRFDRDVYGDEAGTKVAIYEPRNVHVYLRDAAAHSEEPWKADWRRDNLGPVMIRSSAGDLKGVGARLRDEVSELQMWLENEGETWARSMAGFLRNSD